MQSITGTYAMKEWNEEPLRDLPPPQKCTRVEAHGPMSGTMDGDAQTFYVLAYVTKDTGTFSGYTYFTGKIGDKEGAFVMADDGTFDAKSATTKWTIVTDSGTGGLVGISGTGGFSATQGLTVEFTLDYQLPS